MSSVDIQNDELDQITPTLDLPVVIVIILAAVIGAFAAVVVLPAWLPGLSQSLLGNEPSGYWYLSRAAGMVAFFLLWFSIALGIAITNKLSRIWPGGPAAVDLHQFTSLLALTIAIFHGLVLLGDRYANYSLAQILIPFAIQSYRPLWVGLGQLGFYIMIPVAFSFYARKFLGYRTWRMIHYASFLVYLFVTAHGIWSGTDTMSPSILTFYVLTVLITYFLLVYRILISARQPRQRLTD